MDAAELIGVERFWWTMYLGYAELLVAERVAGLSFV